MSESKFKTMRHIETVRNYLNAVIKELLDRSQRHDQTKLQPPEVDDYEKYTPLLHGLTYGSKEYRQILKEMKPAIDHHYHFNRHHPEFFKKYVCNGCFKETKHEPLVCDVCGYSQFQKESDVSQMTLIDLIEMFCDWKAATLRHENGDIIKSIEMNKERFHYSEELKNIFLNTEQWLREQNVQHWAKES